MTDAERKDMLELAWVMFKFSQTRLQDFIEQEFSYWVEDDPGMARLEPLLITAWNHSQYLRAGYVQYVRVHGLVYATEEGV